MSDEIRRIDKQMTDFTEYYVVFFISCLFIIILCIPLMSNIFGCLNKKNSSLRENARCEVVRILPSI